MVAARGSRLVETRLQTDALVLRAVAVGDDARLVTLFTREHGVQTVRVPMRLSVRSAKDALEPLHSYHCELGLRERDVARLLSCQLLRSRDVLTQGELALASAGAWLRLVRESLWPGAVDAELFELVTDVLDLLVDAGVDASRIAQTEVFGRMRLLGLLGYGFETEHCVACGRTRAGNRAAHLSGARAGIVCAHCGADEPVVAGATLAWLRAPEGHDPPAARELRVLASALQEALRVHARGQASKAPSVIRSDT